MVSRIQCAYGYARFIRVISFAHLPIVLLALSASTAAIAQAPGVAGENKSKPTAKDANPLNDELLKGLGPDPLAEQTPASDKGTADSAGTPKDRSTKDGSANDASAKQDKTPPAGKPSTKGIGDPLDDELLKGLSQPEDIPSEGDESDPFLRLNRQMRKVESLIARTKLDPGTQQLQQKIVHDLEELIKKLQQQKSSASSSAKSSAQQQTARRDKVAQPGAEKGKDGAQDSDQPAKDSSEQLRRRQAQRPDLDQLQDLLGKGVWGQLPQKVRDQMLQSSVDQFLPKYELLIEEYFKSIATRGRDKR